MENNDDIDNPLIIEDDEDDFVEETGLTNETLESTSSKKGKKRKLTSHVWKYFTVLPKKEDQPLFCQCNKCGTKYKASSACGTGNLSRHILKCSKNTTKYIGQYMLSCNNGLLNTQNPKFSQEKFRELLIIAIVRHEMPFSFTEYEGFRDLFKYLESSVTHISRNTTKSDIIKLYEHEKNRLRSELVRCPSRICLTSDAWTSIVTDGYLSLTAHFVDCNWVLQKRILNFSAMPPPHTGVALAEKLSGLIKSWGIEKKLFSITLDNASANDVCVELLKTQFRSMKSLVLDGKLFHVRCTAHILNLIVQDGLKQIDVSVEKVRVCCKYVKGSQGRKDKFSQACEVTLLDNKKALIQDVPTRWNYTYKMLTCAFYYRAAFCHLSMSDTNFQSCPSSDEWDKIEKICSFLKVFYEATLQFSGTLYPTSNLYFPQIFGIHMKLVEELESSDVYMKNIATQMWAKFQKYWADFNLLLAIAVVFDPRYKYSFVEFCYTKIYGKGSDELKVVEVALFALFDEYMQASKKSSSTTSCGSSSSNKTDMDLETSQSILQEFDEYDKDESISNKKSQLQLYLLEPRDKRTCKINMLDFWKAQQYRYPELARLAMDIICVPVSTVASESAFSLGGRILNEYRSSMTSSTVEAVICAKDWLFGESKVKAYDVNDLTRNIMTMNIDDDKMEDTNSNKL